MEKSRIGSATLAAAMVAAGVALTILAGPFAWLASIGGLLLLLILLSYDQDGYRSLAQSLAFSAVCGLCLAIACGVLLQLLAARGEVHLQNGQWSSVWLPLMWAFGTAIFLAIDRARMSAREPVEMRQARARAAVPQGFIPRPNLTPEPAGPAASLVRGVPVEQTTPRAPLAQPTYSEPAPPISHSEPVAASLYSEPPVRASAAAAPTSSVASLSAAAVSSDVAVPAALTLNPAPIVPRTGTPATIYVTLTGEGLNMLRSVEAEHLGRDYYRIVEATPEGETWQFQTGQVVRCKKRNLSSGKAMVAIEEAPRAQ